MEPKQLEEFNGMYNICFGSDIQSNEAILLLHGFPAENGDKNSDIAECLSQTLGLDSYVIHYPGLGRSKGRFGFANAIESSVLYAENLINNKSYSRVHLLGHSFGGFIAFNVIHILKEKIGKCLLLSPFNKMPTGDELVSLAEVLLSECAYLLEGRTTQSLVAELKELDQLYSPRNFLHLLDVEDYQITIFQAENDPEVPDQTSFEITRLIKSKVNYSTFEVDHAFMEEREELKKKITTQFENWLC